MTKAEYLESIGYIRKIARGSIGYIRKIARGSMIYYYQKSFDKVFMVIDIQLDDFMIWIDCIRTQKDIDNLQIAFNNVKRDFEEMQKYD